MNALCEPLEQNLLNYSPPPQGRSDLFAEDSSNAILGFQSYRPFRAEFLIAVRFQGFAKSAHPWLISSHPSGVEEARHRNSELEY